MPKRLLSILLPLLILAPLSAQEAWNRSGKEVPKEPVREFQFIGYYINQLVANNVYAENEFLKGQTVGRLFGGNTSTTDNRATTYVEQRLIPFFIYQPKLLGGKALLRASFEIDWTWGDVAYGAGGNNGAGLSADQVNLQTQNVELEFLPAPGWQVNLGLQRMFDTPYNPYRTFFSTMSETGYRLAFFGTDAAGISVRKEGDYSRWKGGFYQFYENNIQDRDDVFMWELFHERDLTPTWRQGLSFWYVQDRASGEGGVSILSNGLNSLLNDYNGTFRFNVGNRPYEADIFWAGTFWSRNPGFTLGRWLVSGFAIANAGQMRLSGDAEPDAIDILGGGANLRLGYKYGQTARDAVTADLIFTSGDDNGISDGEYNGVITGNTWGSPGAIYISSGAYLLLPHGNVVNRYIAAVSDLSNLGRGFAGGTVNFSRDIVPNTFYAKLGGAFGVSQTAPSTGGNLIGTEVNGMIGWQPHVFMNLEFHAAYLALGDFYDSPQLNGGRGDRPDNPWTAFLVFKWLMF